MGRTLTNKIQAMGGDWEDVLPLLCPSQGVPGNVSPCTPFLSSYPHMPKGQTYRVPCCASHGSSQGRGQSCQASLHGFASFFPSCLFPQPRWPGLALPQEYTGTLMFAAVSFSRESRLVLGGRTYSVGWYSYFRHCPFQLSPTSLCSTHRMWLPFGDPPLVCKVKPTFPHLALAAL